MIKKWHWDKAHGAHHSSGLKKAEHGQKHHAKKAGHFSHAKHDAGGQHKHGEQSGHFKHGHKKHGHHHGGHGLHKHGHKKWHKKHPEVWEKKSSGAHDDGYGSGSHDDGYEGRGSAKAGASRDPLAGHVMVEDAFGNLHLIEPSALL